MSARAAIWLVWLCFVVRLAFYCAAMPLWEGFDEFGHFAVVQWAALRSGLPDMRTARINRQIGQSLYLAPVPGMLRHPESGWLGDDEYWQLPAEERARRQAQLRALPAAWALDDNTDLTLWEAQQPPLYYWLMAPVYRLMRGWDLPAQAWILRCLTALMASVVVPCVFFAARRVMGDDRVAVGAAVLVALMPELFISACRVGNEAMAIGMGAVVVTLGLTGPGVLFGAALGVALLTKAYFLAFVPWAIFVLVRRCGIRRAAVAMGVCVAISAWWYVRTFLRTGTVSGEQRDVLAHAAAHFSMGAAILHMPWKHTWDFVITSFIWLGGWSFLAIRSWMYRVVEALLAMALVGAVFKMRKRPQLIGLAALIVCLLAGMAYHAIAAFRSINDTNTMGYYLYCLVVAEAILMVAGLGRFAPLMAFGFLAIETFATWVYLVPYYAGLIRHDSSAHLPAAHFSQFSLEMFRRLTANKPIGLGAMMVFVILYICATATLAFMNARWLSTAFRRDAKPPA